MPAAHFHPRCNRCVQLDENVQTLREVAQEQCAVQIKLETQLTAAAQRLGAKHRVMAEVGGQLETVWSGAVAAQPTHTVSTNLLGCQKSPAMAVGGFLMCCDALVYHAKGHDTV